MVIIKILEFNSSTKYSFVTIENNNLKLEDI